MLKTYLATCLLILLASTATAQKVKKPQDAQFRNVELCNGSSAPETSIEACSAFIDAGRGGRSAQATAHNNRGIAYAEKADYARAVTEL